MGLRKVWTFLFVSPQSRLNLYKDSPFKKYLDGCIRGAATIGRNLRVPERYKAYLERIGCEWFFTYCKKTIWSFTES